MNKKYETKEFPVGVTLEEASNAQNLLDEMRTLYATVGTSSDELWQETWRKWDKLTDREKVVFFQRCLLLCENALDEFKFYHTHVVKDLLRSYRLVSDDNS